jgi:hypothetical protein
MRSRTTPVSKSRSGSWLRDLELRDTIGTIADDLAEFPTWDLRGADEEEIWKGYPGW